jgi:cytochrome c553
MTLPSTNALRRLALATLLVGIAGFAAAQAGRAAEPAPSASDIVRRGMVEHGTRACQSCHGATGMGDLATKTPRLAGLDAEYLQRQLDLFADERRRNPVMNQVARTLSPDQREALAQYYAAQPVNALPPQDAKADFAAGARLAQEGHWGVDVPPCASCHASDGLGSGSVAPALAGQSARYLAAQLDGWRDGDRRGDPQGLMGAIAKRLTPAEIKAVAAYYAAQPAGPPSHPKPAQ